jgi:ATP-binding cassette subfamily B protein
LQTITPGDFVAFISYLGLLTWPMMATGWVTNLIQRGRASLGRINAILETRPEIESPVDAVSVQHFKGRVVFDKVSFSYGSSPDRTPAEISGRPLRALSDISFHLAPEKVLGIIGPPGSGKTTLLNLIPRLFDATAGRISIDGRDIRELDLSDLRSHILFMPQEPFIFAGSIRENMSFSRPTAGDDADLIRAAKQAALYETIQKLPAGFDTLIGEKGVTLSGGQKQRLALARSLMQDGGLWILDDPISQVDVETGRDIIRTITAATGKKTVIIVSHRLSAVRHADLILVLDNGRIAASGTHDSLMARDSYYAKTFQLQQIEEELHAG